MGIIEQLNSNDGVVIEKAGWFGPIRADTA
jgi:hypothetical protein